MHPDVLVELRVVFHNLDMGQDLVVVGPPLLGCLVQHTGMLDTLNSQRMAPYDPHALQEAFRREESEE